MLHLNDMLGYRFKVNIYIINMIKKEKWKILYMFLFFLSVLFYLFISIKLIIYGEAKILFTRTNCPVIRNYLSPRNRNLLKK